MPKTRILVIDDEPQIHRFLQPALSAGGYEPVRADNGQRGLIEIARRAPDAVLLDLGLPDLDGHQVLSKARTFYQGPIIILSARSQEIDKIQALDAGADDYVGKPFRVGELLARLRAAMRHAQPGAGSPAAPEEQLVQAGELVIDLQRRLIKRAGMVVNLSPKEYDLLAKLVQADGRVLTARELLISLRGPWQEENLQYLRVFIAQLRQKIEVDPSAPRLILTETGLGYRFISDGAVRDQRPARAAGTRL
jgi:two-component system KDP operon response regulator KdpE